MTRSIFGQFKRSLTLVTIAGLGAGTAWAAGAPSSHPTQLSDSYRDGQHLESLPPWPSSVIVKPLKGHRFVRWYEGPEITSMIYEADDGIIKLENLSYDEHSYIIHGTAILTSSDGKVSEFRAGDTFVVPKGWNGTWEFKDGYREEITFYRVSLDDAMKSLFGK